MSCHMTGQTRRSLKDIDWARIDMVYLLISATTTLIENGELRPDDLTRARFLHATDQVLASMADVHRSVSAMTPTIDRFLEVLRSMTASRGMSGEIH